MITMILGLFYFLAGLTANEIALRKYEEQNKEKMPLKLQLATLFFWPVFLFFSLFGEEPDISETQKGEDDDTSHH